MIHLAAPRAWSQPEHRVCGFAPPLLPIRGGLGYTLGRHNIVMIDGGFKDDEYKH